MLGQLGLLSSAPDPCETPFVMAVALFDGALTRQNGRGNEGLPGDRRCGFHVN